VISGPRSQRICLSRRIWWKQFLATWLIYRLIVNSESNRTPRSWTTGLSLITVWSLICRKRSEAVIFWRLHQVPNQISTIFDGFSCSRHDKHQRWVATTHCCRRSLVEWMSATDKDPMSFATIFHIFLQQCCKLQHTYSYHLRSRFCSQFIEFSLS